MPFSLHFGTSDINTPTHIQERERREEGKEGEGREKRGKEGEGERKERERERKRREREGESGNRSHFDLGFLFISSDNQKRYG